MILYFISFPRNSSVGVLCLVFSFPLSCGELVTSKNNMTDVGVVQSRSFTEEDSQPLLSVNNSGYVPLHAAEQCHAFD